MKMKAMGTLSNSDSSGYEEFYLLGYITYFLEIQHPGKICRFHLQG
jgi:hypothetical protein